jgi:hypothetical protein
MNTDTKNVYDVLDAAPDCARAVAWLANWSYNESYETGSAWLEFLDLTGISADRYGGHVNRRGYRPGYLEADKLGAALIEYADRPEDVREYVAAIMDADN